MPRPSFEVRVESPAVRASSLTWILGGSLPAERLELALLDGASVTLRRVSAEDQARWRDKRRHRMMGFGALGDDGDDRARSYVYLPIPEWVLDCCTVCVEVSRSAALATGLADDQLFSAGFAATESSQLDLGSTAVVDLLRLIVGQANLQVPMMELLLTATVGHYGQNHQAVSTPGFLWKHASERWSFEGGASKTLTEWWTKSIAGPNAEIVRWPLRRFGVAKQRAFVEDRLVDLAIALEAIFVEESDSQRNTRALIAGRANRLLGGDRVTRKHRTSRLLAAYDTRSDLVHGRLPPEDEVEAAAASLESVLREALPVLLLATHRYRPGAGADQGPQVTPRNTASTSSS